MSAPKTVESAKEWEKDPRITRWEEVEEEKNPTTRRPPARGMRDWMVLGLAFLLLLYIVAFLFAGPSTPASRGGDLFSGRGNVALIPIQGEISTRTSNNTIGYHDIVQALQEAGSDSSITAIFLDIDSPGGSVVSSKQMVAAIRDVNKPVVSWIGEAGASGAYYAASATDYIMADSDSITGSIGVISRQENVKGLLDKLGIEVEDITTGKFKGIGSPYNEFTDEEKQVFQVLVNQAFESFVNDVKTFRGEKLNPQKFDAILDGRILSGKQSLEIGLIDATGTREQAILKAGELGGIRGKPTLIPFVEKEFSFADLLFSMGASFGKGLKSEWTRESSTGIDAK